MTTETKGLTPEQMDAVTTAVSKATIKLPRPWRASLTIMTATMGIFAATTLTVAIYMQFFEGCSVDYVADHVILKCRLR